MVKTKSKVKVLPVDSKVLEEVLKVVAQVVEPLPQPEEDDTFLLHRDDDEPEPEPQPEPEPEPKPEPKPVRVKKLRPCERVKTPEDLERKRLHREKRAIEDAEVIEYLESLK